MMISLRVLQSRIKRLRRRFNQPRKNKHSREALLPGYKRQIDLLDSQVHFLDCYYSQECVELRHKYQAEEQLWISWWNAYREEPRPFFYSPEEAKEFLRWKFLDAFMVFYLLLLAFFATNFVFSCWGVNRELGKHYSLLFGFLSFMGLGFFWQLMVFLPRFLKKVVISFLFCVWIVSGIFAFLVIIGEGPSFFQWQQEWPFLVFLVSMFLFFVPFVRNQDQCLEAKKILRIRLPLERMTISLQKLRRIKLNVHLLQSELVEMKKFYSTETGKISSENNTTRLLSNDMEGPNVLRDRSIQGFFSDPNHFDDCNIPDVIFSH